jgi:hypothetical protein
MSLLLLALLTALTLAGPADSELAALGAKVPHFQVIALPAAGELNLTAAQSLTIDDLRGVMLDDDPPRLGALAEPYDPRQTDDFAPGAAPYCARDIAPFRFRYFHCELNYGGWHNLAMQEYGATHGFDIVFPYVRKASQRSRLPPGTGWLKWGGFVDWDAWLPKHGLPAGRWDLLGDRDLVGELAESKFLGQDDPADFSNLMIDMEHAALSPEQLRKQEWYPKAAGEAERAAFEQRYYHGYALTFVAPMAAAKRLGYKNLSVYGWEPFARQWWGLDTLHFAPETYWQWQRFGREIYQSDATDILNPSLYVFYWSPQNVASTICNLDYNRALAATMPQRKPLRPYYWTLLHGGDADRHWWTEQPVPNEDARAWTFFCLMSGADGFDLWNWSGTGNHHRPRPFRTKEKDHWVGNDLGLKDGFICRAEGAPADAAPTRFERYDFIHVLSAEDGAPVRFQKIDRDNWRGKYGLTPDAPVYAMPPAELTPHLRVESEPVAGVIEGMALAKPLEYLLSHGEVEEDVSSLAQFLQALPIVRRVRLGRISLLATYDPGVVHGGAGRTIVLKDFAGKAGVSVSLPADRQVRVFVVREG